MGELYNPFPKLPKNIRQIGERDQSVRLYLEDYVNTYLKRLYPKGGQDLRVGILLGSTEEHDGTPYIFADGAMEMEDVTENGEKVVFTEAAWKKVYQNMEQMFPKRVILGWFLCGAPESTLSPLNYWKQHGQYFAGKNQLMYLNPGLEGEESIYIASEDGFYKLRGYSIYYERNQMMQDYMILRKDVRRVESGNGDTVIRDFRQRMEEHKSQAVSRRGTIRVLGGVCSMLSIMVLAGGVVTFNNYEKMKKMEAVLTSALPVGAAENYIGSTSGAGSYKLDMDYDELPVEEARGQVYPTAADETMQSEYPGTSDGTQAGNSVIGQAETIQNSNGTGQAESSRAADSTSADTSGASSSSAPGDMSTTVNAQGQTVYRVQDGETLYSICLKFYHSLSRVSEICELNGLEDENKIMSGQNLILP